MLKVPLQIKPCAQAIRPAAAWFLPGSKSSDWLADLCHCSPDQTVLRLYPVPRSVEDRKIAGVLVTGISGARVIPPHALQMGKEGDSLFLPVDAILDPPLSKEELKALCLHPVMFWHPVTGLAGFEEDQAHSLLDLLNPPDWREEDWSAAHPGIPAAPPISSIALRMPPEDLKLFFKEESQDIGGQSLKDLPPSPREPTDSPLDKLRRGIKGGIVRGVQGAAGMISGVGAGAGAAFGGLAGNLSNWAGKQLQGLSAELDKVRNKELLRLMELLKSDPEAGLRRAIPLGEGGAHRGIAPPGMRLLDRDINFNLGGLGGGGLADFWNIPGDWQAELRQLYQRLANRELSLHRYRRAAYIYAELLGDISAAATALKQGKFYAEAAVLYRDRLNRPLEAASCLAEGGFYKQALEIYEKQGSLLEAAALYRKLGEEAEAEACVRKLVAIRKTAGDYLGAADLLERELGAIEESLETLDTAWPSLSQAVPCKQRWFATLGRLGRHEETKNSLREMKRSQWTGDQTLSLAEVLLKLAENYPDHAVRHTAADISRVQLSRQLAKPDSRKLSDYVSHLRRLAPDDKLLNRDGVRFVTSLPPPKKPPVRALLPAQGVAMPTKVKEFSLPAHVSWQYAFTHGSIVYFLGVEEKNLHCLRGVWEGVYQGMSWPIPSRQPFAFTVLPGERTEAVIGPMLDRRFTMKYFTSNSRFGMVASEAGTPSWLPDQVLALTATPNAIWVLRWDSNRFILASHRHNDGALIHQEDLTDMMTEKLQSVHPPLAYQMTALGPYVVIALGNVVMIWHSDRPFQAIECSGIISGLVRSSPYSRPFVLVQHERGVDLLWLDKCEITTVADDVQDPQCTLTTEGQVVLLAGNEGRVYQPSSRAATRAGSFTWPQGTPVALVPAGQPGHFATLTSLGKVTVYRL